MVSQPILGLSTGRVVAYEALSRFSPELPSYSPDVWFAMAHGCGLGAMFEARAVDLALRAGGARPPDTILSVNVSPSVLSSRELHDVLPFDLSGLQFEITEQEVVDDADHFHAGAQGTPRPRCTHRRRRRRRGVRRAAASTVAVARPHQARPIAGDRSRVRTGQGGARRSRSSRYAGQGGAEVCAEGVENLDDLLRPGRPRRRRGAGLGHRHAVTDYEPVSEAAALTCQSSYQRTLALGSRAPGQDTTALERLLADLVELPRPRQPGSDDRTDRQTTCGATWPRSHCLDADRRLHPRHRRARVAAGRHVYPVADFPADAGAASRPSRS